MTVERCCSTRSASSTRTRSRSQPFVPGVTEIWPSGALLDAEDRVALVEAALDMRIAAGPLARRFESEFARKLHRRKAHLTNSGSSANLLAVSALTSHLLGDRAARARRRGHHGGGRLPDHGQPDPAERPGAGLRRRRPGHLQHHRRSGSPRRSARGPGPSCWPTRWATPSSAGEIAELADAHDLFFVEDNCDAVGSTYDGTADRHLRRPDHGELLPGPPPDHG